MYIRIECNSDGSHAAQYGGNLEPGWAFWDEDKIPVPESFPYVDITVEEVEFGENTRMEVVSATEKEIPNIPELELEPTEEELQWQAITDLEIAQMEYEQALTDLEIEVLSNER